MTIRKVICHICEHKFEFDIPNDGVERWNGTGLNCPKNESHSQVWKYGTVVLI